MVKHASLNSVGGLELSPLYYSMSPNILHLNLIEEHGQTYLGESFKFFHVVVFFFHYTKASIRSIARGWQTTSLQEINVVFTVLTV